LRLYLVHHGDAVGPDMDIRRPLSAGGRSAVDRLAADAAVRGVKPAIVWHSGKLRAKQTAEAFWRACNPFAEFGATRDVQPGDRPEWMRDRLQGEARDVLLAGHFPYLPELLSLLTGGVAQPFPLHGVVALESNDNGVTWVELWRAD
jgi:phosphohistidine phosphatase